MILKNCISYLEKCISIAPLQYHKHLTRCYSHFLLISIFILLVLSSPSLLFPSFFSSHSIIIFHTLLWTLPLYLDAMVYMNGPPVKLFHGEVPFSLSGHLLFHYSLFKSAPYSSQHIRGCLFSTSASSCTSVLVFS